MGCNVSNFTDDSLVFVVFEFLRFSGRLMLFEIYFGNFALKKRNHSSFYPLWSFKKQKRFTYIKAPRSGRIFLSVFGHFGVPKRNVEARVVHVCMFV